MANERRLSNIEEISFRLVSFTPIGGRLKCPAVPDEHSAKTAIDRVLTTENSVSNEQQTIN